MLLTFLSGGLKKANYPKALCTAVKLSIKDSISILKETKWAKG